MLESLGAIYMGTRWQLPRRNVEFVTLGERMAVLLRRRVEALAGSPEDSSEAAELAELGDVVAEIRSLGSFCARTGAAIGFEI